jgi:hypothetical protein
LRTRPLAFLRTLLCVKGKGLRRAACPVKPSFDVLGAHPISTSGGPQRSAIHPDDVSTPDLPGVMRTLRVAERKSRLSPRRHPLWVTEFWWNTNPPNTVRGVSPPRQARYIEGALYEFWKAKVAVALNLQLTDAPYNPAQPLSTSQSGLFFADGAQKPSFQAFRFPFVAQRVSTRALRFWGKAPATGPLVVQRRVGKRWRAVAKRSVARGAVFTGRVRFRGQARMRAVSGPEKSLVWRTK